MAQFFNQAKLSYNGITTTSNLATGEVVSNLEMTKTSVEKTYEQNSEIRYVITIQNKTNTAYTALTLQDDLGTYEFNGTQLTPMKFVDGTIQYYVNGASQGTLASTYATTLTINNIAVPANGNAIIAYTVKTNEYAPLGADGEITNTATLTGNGISSAVTAQATVTASQGTMLSISKTATPTTVTDNDPLTFTFVIQNLGSVEAGTDANVQLIDELDPILSDLTVTYNGTEWTAPDNYSYNQDTGLFTSVLGEITVPAAQFTQDPDTGAWAVTPGCVTVVITGTV